MKNIYKLLLIIIWMLFIFIMSSFDGNESANQSNFIVYFISRFLNITNINLLSQVVRKLAHFTEYLILGLLVRNYLKDCHKKLSLDIIICFVYSTCDEVHQMFVPGRSFQLYDILIDTIGFVVGIIILNKIVGDE